jgi:hypothetical protein
MSNLDQAQLNQIVAAVIQALGNQPKAASASSAKPSFDPADKDRRILATFKKRGFTNVVLMDRSNPKADFNVRPFKAWLAQGRIVRRGQKSVMGLFHVTQTDPLPDNQPKGKGKKPSLKPVPTDTQSTLPLA